MAKYAIAIRGRRGTSEGFRVISGLESRDHAEVVAGLTDRHRTFKKDQSYEHGDLLVFESLTLPEFVKRVGVKTVDIEKAVQARRDERVETASRVAAEARRKQEDREAAERQRVIAERAQELRDNALQAELAEFMAKATALVDAEAG